ncbi:cell wall metabolism sensor histidine kinase WalK [uncultured Arthrobacter sp.]|uniref:sensor histidine kinase n=1 Tax=uncultured Arthrobacter sp. TaxID=114050 RepID=UPI002616A3A9|nr:PAS domain-containing sensor histidine kinase [uncultured Arthrobacter sp.]
MSRVGHAAPAPGTRSRPSLDRSVPICQLPLALIALALAVSAAVRPGAAGTGFVLGVSTILGLLVVSLLVPGLRLPAGVIVVVPVLDFVAIGLLRSGPVENQPGLGILVVFPVLWLVRSRVPLWMLLGLTVLGSLVAQWPLLVEPRDDPYREALLPIVMLCVGVVLRLTNDGARTRAVEARRRDSELQDLLQAAIDRERVLTAILNTVDVGLTAVDAHGTTTLTNRQQELFDRLSAGPDHEREPYPLVFAPDGVTPLPPELRPVPRALRGETFADQLLWVGDGDAQRALSTAARPITNADGDIAGALIVCSDVTELVEAVSAKDAFISNISHEFHAPLTSVLGYLELVQEDEHPLPDRLRDHLDVAGRNAERVLHLVADLLSTAGDRVRVHPRPVDLAALIEMSVRSNRLKAEKHGVQLRTEVRAPLWTLIDPLRISQVLDNLLSNAIKYTEHGGPVTIRADETQTAITLQVEDRGMGMSEQETRQIFSRFYRTPAARRSEIDGAGLGLAITRAIVEGHGGSIGCTSSPGEGSCFTVTLPVNGEVERMHQETFEGSV